MDKQKDLKSQKNHRKIDSLGEYGRTGGPGRPKGCKNKFTAIKADILWVWEKGGGREKLLEYASKNIQNWFKFCQLTMDFVPKPKHTEVNIDQSHKHYQVGWDKIKDKVNRLSIIRPSNPESIENKRLTENKEVEKKNESDKNSENHNI